MKAETKEELWMEIFWWFSFIFLILLSTGYLAGVVVAYSSKLAHLAGVGIGFGLGWMIASRLAIRWQIKLLNALFNRAYWREDNLIHIPRDALQKASHRKVVITKS